jgi:hypothetical protein
LLFHAFIFFPYRRFLSLFFFDSLWSKSLFASVPNSLGTVSMPARLKVITFLLPLVYSFLLLSCRHFDDSLLFWQRNLQRPTSLSTRLLKN